MKKARAINYINQQWDGSWSTLEHFCALSQGKGWGTATIEEEITACCSLINQLPKTIIDVGANKGDYTAELLKRFPHSKYFLFEPSSSNTETLKGKFKQNDNVSIYPIALSNESGQQILYSNEDGSGLASLTKRRLEHFNISMHLEESVEVLSFEDFLDKFSLSELGSKIIDYVKIDVEGHEIEVLEGFGATLKNMRLIQFEFGGCNIDTRTYFQDFWYFFKDKNFSIYRISPDGPEEITLYSELDEYFSTTNYICINKLHC